ETTQLSDNISKLIIQHFTKAIKDGKPGVSLLFFEHVLELFELSIQSVMESVVNCVMNLSTRLTIDGESNDAYTIALGIIQLLAKNVPFGEDEWYEDVLWKV